MAKLKVWLLYRVDKKRERFKGAFPHKYEAVQHVREGYGHTMTRYRIRGIDPDRIRLV
jgi:hypothetical protein